MATYNGDDNDNIMRVSIDDFAEDDVIRGFGGNDIINGLAGNDLLDGGEGIDTAEFTFTGSGFDINLQTGVASDPQDVSTLISIENVVGSRLRDIIVGDDGDNTLEGGAGNDDINGGGGNDVLIGGDGDDVLTGGDGNDVMISGLGKDTMRGSAGIDTVDYSNTIEGVLVDLVTGLGVFGAAQGDLLTGIENLSGSRFDDRFSGDNGANFLAGGDGDDELNGGAGNDKIEGGAGADTLDGGDGVDQLRYAGSSSGVFVSLFGNLALLADAAGDTIINFEDLIGSNFDDVLEGNDGANFLGGLNGGDQMLGQGGDDILFGDGGNDGLDGGEGSDVLVGGAGADVLAGGAGIDAASYANAGSAVTVSLAANSGTGSDAAGDTFSGIENLIGSRFGDTLDGDNGGNTLFGLDGDDTLRGLDGADSLDGGLGGDRLFGGAGNDFLVGGAGADEIVGGSGIDRVHYGASGAGVQVFLDAKLGFQGDAQGDTFDGVEEVVGSNFVDTLVGDAENNFIGGLAGDDFMSGNEGNDKMFGDAGIDQLFGGDGGDFLVGGVGADTLDGGAGIDRVSYHTSGASVLVILGAKLGFDGDAQGDTLEGIEEVIGSSFGDTLAGDAGNNFLGGLDGADVLSGEDGADALFGDAGDDALDGGNGNDILVGGAGGDKMNGGAGIDTASYANAGAAISVNISDDDIFVVAGDAAGDEFTSIENLIGSNFDDGMVGNDGKNRLSGGDGRDVIQGRGGDDVLDGGAGLDDLFGGLGNDLFFVTIGDNVVERAGEGTADRVAALTSFTLESTDNIEVLTTIDAKGTKAIDLTGNALKQKIAGNAGDNTLHDGGTGKADTLIGLGGNDTYRVFNSGDIIVEKAGEGTADKVVVAVDYVLKAGVNVELMSTNGSTGTAAIDLTGNALKQEIVGNAGVNILHDGGTGKADVMKGMGGNDTYRVFNTGDIIVESSTQGTADKVVAAVDYRLGTGVDIEILATNGSTGTAAIDLTGNEFGQEIVGNSGANRLSGGGGADTLRGGSGADTFVFAATLGAGNVDKILDFSVPADRMLLSDAIFTALDTGTLSASAFRANNTGLAQDANDHVIYERDTGKLFYDADGVGGQAGIHFATVTVGLALTNADFSVA